MTKYSNVTPYRETNNFFASPTLYENIIEFLHDEIIEVSFYKKAGTERVMKCTLKQDLIPKSAFANVREDFGPGKPAFGTHENTSDAENAGIKPSYINVWSVDDKGWRSFIVDNVKYIKTNLDESV